VLQNIHHYLFHLFCKGIIVLLFIQYGIVVCVLETSRSVKSFTGPRSSQTVSKMCTSLSFVIICHELRSAASSALLLQKYLNHFESGPPSRHYMMNQWFFGNVQDCLIFLKFSLSFPAVRDSLYIILLQLSQRFEFWALWL